MDNLKNALRRSKYRLTNSFRKITGSSKHSRLNTNQSINGSRDTLRTVDIVPVAARLAARTASGRIVGPVLRSNWEDTSSVADYSSTESANNSGVAAGPASSNGQRRRITITARVGISAAHSAQPYVASAANSVMPASFSDTKPVNDDANLSTEAARSVSGSIQTNFFTPTRAIESATVQVAAQGDQGRNTGIVAVPPSPRQLPSGNLSSDTFNPSDSPFLWLNHREHQRLPGRGIDQTQAAPPAPNFAPTVRFPPAQSHVEHENGISNHTINITATSSSKAGISCAVSGETSSAAVQDPPAVVPTVIVSDGESSNRAWDDTDLDQFDTDDHHRLVRVGSEEWAIKSVQGSSSRGSGNAADTGKSVSPSSSKRAWDDTDLDQFQDTGDQRLVRVGTEEWALRSAERSSSPGQSENGRPSPSSSNRAWDDTDLEQFEAGDDQRLVRVATDEWALKPVTSSSFSTSNNNAAGGQNLNSSSSTNRAWDDTDLDQFNAADNQQHMVRTGTQEWALQSGDVNANGNGNGTYSIISSNTTNSSNRALTPSQPITSVQFQGWGLRPREVTSPSTNGGGVDGGGEEDDESPEYREGLVVLRRRRTRASQQPVQESAAARPVSEPRQPEPVVTTTTTAAVTVTITPPTPRLPTPTPLQDEQQLYAAAASTPAGGNFRPERGLYSSDSEVEEVVQQPITPGPRPPPRNNLGPHGLNYIFPHDVFLPGEAHTNQWDSPRHFVPFQQMDFAGITGLDRALQTAANEHAQVYREREAYRHNNDVNCFKVEVLQNLVAERDEQIRNQQAEILRLNQLLQLRDTELSSIQARVGRLEVEYYGSVSASASDLASGPASGSGSGSADVVDDTVLHNSQSSSSGRAQTAENLLSTRVFNQGPPQHATTSSPSSLVSPDSIDDEDDGNGNDLFHTATGGVVYNPDDDDEDDTDDD